MGTTEKIKYTIKEIIENQNGSLQKKKNQLNTKEGNHRENERQKML